MSVKQAEKSTFERHAQTLVQMLIAALCIYMADTVNETAKEVAVQSERLVAMKEQITRLKNRSHDRYTSSDAIRDFSVITDKIDRIILRLDKVESK